MMYAKTVFNVNNFAQLTETNIRAIVSDVLFSSKYDVEKEDTFKCIEKILDESRDRFFCYVNAIIPVLLEYSTKESLPNSIINYLVEKMKIHMLEQKMEVQYMNPQNNWIFGMFLILKRHFNKKIFISLLTIMDEEMPINSDYENKLCEFFMYGLDVLVKLDNLSKDEFIMLANIGKNTATREDQFNKKIYKKIFECLQICEIHNPNSEIKAKTDKILRDIIFICYSHNDLKYVNEFEKFFATSKLNYWYDKKMEAGQKFEDEIKKILPKVKIAILFLSQDALNAEYIKDNELPYFLDHHPDILTTWILVKNCTYENVILGDGRVIDIAEHQALTRLSDTPPLDEIKNAGKRNNVYKSILNEIDKLYNK